MGPFGVKISNETDPLTGNTIAWKLSSWEDRAPNTIWMDGRPHPSKNAPHEKAGFSTGVWEGDVLTVYITHIKAGYIRRNGAPSSDQATITEHFIRHGDLLTISALLDDPIYFDEPMYWTRTLQLNSAPINPTGPPCIRDDEGPEAGSVPHYLPGKNPFVGELTPDLRPSRGSHPGRRRNRISGISQEDQGQVHPPRQLFAKLRRPRPRRGATSAAPGTRAKLAAIP